MNIIDHLSVGVPNIEQAGSFYQEVMSSLGCTCLAKSEYFAAYGKDNIQFLLMVPTDGEAATVGNGTHICFVASEQSAVDKFHQVALENGGSCEGKPGLRPEYPIPDVYTTFVRDPYGNKLEAIYKGFNG